MRKTALCLILQSLATSCVIAMDTYISGIKKEENIRLKNSPKDLNSFSCDEILQIVQCCQDIRTDVLASNQTRRENLTTLGSQKRDLTIIHLKDLSGKLFDGKTTLNFYAKSVASVGSLPSCGSLGSLESWDSTSEKSGLSIAPSIKQHSPLNIIIPNQRIKKATSVIAENEISRVTIAASCSPASSSSSSLTTRCGRETKRSLEYEKFVASLSKRRCKKQKDNAQ